MVNTYYIVTELINEFPTAFVTSKSPKYIHVRHCRCVFENYLVADIELHASFIQRDDYCDGFVCFTNTQLTKHMKYEFTGTRPEFKLWFINMDGEPVDVQKFKLEMTSEY